MKTMHYTKKARKIQCERQARGDKRNMEKLGGSTRDKLRETVETGRKCEGLGRQKNSIRGQYFYREAGMTKNTGGFTWKETKGNKGKRGRQGVRP